MSADIDIDFADREQVLRLIEATPARMVVQEGQVRKHASGIYATDIPWDPVHECAAIPFQKAEQLGYFKLDLLNMTVYTLVRDQAHYDQMLATEPPWHRLWTDDDFARQIVHVGGSIHLLRSMRPNSIPRMAAFISIIRPGKAHLQNCEWNKVFESVWDGDDSKGFVFKKSHAISYARLVALHMNLINEINPPVEPA